MLCDDLVGWDREGGREAQEGGDMGIYVYIQLIHFVIQQKLTQHCKAIILQKRLKQKNKTKQKTPNTLRAKTTQQQITMPADRT